MASRKSARLTAKAEADATAAMHEVKLVQGPRTVKKQKTSIKKDELNDKGVADQSNHSMNLKFMKDIPFDVLLEIFGRLEPIDLLHFSRVSKSLHDLLASNDLKFLWKSAYKNVEQNYQPPLCPNDTNIVLYTNYLYGRHCQFCSSIYGRIYHESAFIRLCSKCAETSFLSLRFDQVDPAVRHLCNKWVLLEYKEDGQMILNTEYSLRIKEFKQAQKEKKGQTYFAERDHAVLQRNKFASYLAQWRKKMQDIERNKLKAIHNKRITDIREKLYEEGFMANFSGLTHAPHVRKSHGLTDSEWCFIRADILDYLQGKREQQSLSVMQTKLQKRILQLEEFISQWKICPTAWWIASSEPVASFIKSDLRKISKGDFDKVEPQIRSLIASWKEETDRYLTTLMPQHSGKGKKKDTCNNKTALELATTFFKCHGCTEPISYPRILMHGCLVEDQEKVEEEDECDMEDLEGDVVADARRPREPRPPKKITLSTAFVTLSDFNILGMCAGKEGITYDEEASNAARDIIAVCGQDPMTVTYATMEGMQARLECLRCSQAMQSKQKAKSVRLVMKWPMAIVHKLEEHYGELPSSDPAWGKIDSLDDLAKVEDAELNVKKLRKYKTPVSCNHCSWVGVTQEQQSGHITSQHNIFVNEDTVSHHFSPQLDASIKTMYPAVKI